MPSALKKLKALSKQIPKPEHFSAFMREIAAEKNDRGAAILLATNVETALDYALISALRGAAFDDLFERDGPLSDFHNKVQMGRALRIYGPETHSNLRIIRHVRNTFAHVRIPITFDTPEVADACQELVIQEVLFPRAVREPPNKKKLGTRQLFTEICNTIAHNLQWLRDEPAIKAATDAVNSAGIPAGLEALIRPQPLP
jgi:hypothetical protein